MKRGPRGVVRRPPLVVVTGPFPPPGHGMAVATERLAAALSARFTVRKFNIAAPSHTSFAPLDAALRALRMLIAFASLTFRRRPLAIFVALSVGHAKLFDLACVSVVLAGRSRLYITHHSFDASTARRRY